MIRQRFINFAWIFVEKFGVLAVSALSFFIFAKYLSPAQLGYGVLAIAIVESFGVFFCMMIEDPLIRTKHFTSSHASSVFWFGSAMVVISMVLLSALMWLFSNDSILWMLVGVASLNTVAVVAARPFIADYRRKRNFKALAKRTLLSKLVGALAGISAAIMGAGAWAIVIQSVVLDVVAFAILFNLERNLLRGKMDWLLFRSIVRQGFPAAVKTSCNSLMARGAIILVGVALSPTIVGYYSFASRLIELPLRAISNGLTSYSVPAIAGRFNKGVNIGRFFIGITIITCALIFPMLVIGGQYFSQFIVPIFGEKWLQALPIFLFLSMVSGLRLFTLFVPGLLVVHGKAKVGIYFEIANTIVSLGIFYILSMQFQVTGAIAALIIFYLSSFVIKIISIDKVIDYPRNQFLYACLCVVFATAMGWVMFYAVNLYFVLGYVQCFLVFVGAIFAYGLVLFGINNNMPKYFKTVVEK
jgi:O-antigen/teichoic acid export membrane protein